jgi:S-adenosyl methyltransferase
VRVDRVSAVDRPDWAPAGIDLDRPSAARVYDYYLGGFHNFAVDREMARRAIEMWPELPEIMKANRAFLRRAVQHLVAAGVRQFLDIGSGIPTVGNVHEVAQQAAPDARVVYVDNDPVAVEHSRAILGGNEQTAVVPADLREPERVLGSPALRRLLDLTEPVALLMVAVLHFVPDEAEPAGLVRRFRDAVAPGSYLVISHASSDGQPVLTQSHRDLYRRTATPMTMRTREQIAAFFDGYDLLEPGLVYLPLWRPYPDAEVDERPERFTGFAGVGRKRDEHDPLA